MPQGKGAGDKRRPAIGGEHLRVFRVAEFQFGVDPLALPNARAVENAGIARRSEPVQIADDAHPVSITRRVAFPAYQHRGRGLQGFAADNHRLQPKLKARVRGRFLIDHAHGFHDATLVWNAGRQRGSGTGLQQISVPGEEQRGHCGPRADGGSADDSLRLHASAQPQPSRKQK